MLGTASLQVSLPYGSATPETYLQDRSNPQHEWVPKTAQDGFMLWHDTKTVFFGNPCCTRSFEMGRVTAAITRSLARSLDI